MPTTPFRQRHLGFQSLMTISLIVSSATTPFLVYAQEEHEENQQASTTQREIIKNKIEEKRQHIDKRQQEHAENLQEKLQNRSSSTIHRLENREDNLQKKIESRASNTAIRLENRKTHLTEVVKARIRAYLQRIYARYSAAIERFEKLSLRIESSISKQEATGTNINEAKRLLGQARSNITEVKAALEQTKTAFEVAILSDDPKSEFETAQDALRGINERIKSVHASLVQTIRALRSKNP